MNPSIYLDYAAATPLDPRVAEAMAPYQTKLFYNPSATYAPAEAVRRDLNEARRLVAAQLGAKEAEIVFTAGATEANNLVIAGVMQNFKNANLVISAIEHDSVMAPAERFKSKIVAVQADGRIDLNDLLRKIDDQTVLVSVIYANHEIGTIEPLGEVADLIAKVRHERLSKDINTPLYLHSDAAQAANYLDLHVSRLGVDLMSLNGGKIYGPKQSGVLYVRAGTRLTPLIFGGGQENNLRSGTENVAAVIGFAKSLNLAQSIRRQESNRLFGLQSDFLSQLKAKLPAVQLNGSITHHLVNNISLTCPGQDNERLLLELEKVGVLAATGSACSASSRAPSHILSAIGLSDNQARATLRISLGQMTTAAELEFTLHALVKLLA